MEVTQELESLRAECRLLREALEQAATELETRQYHPSAVAATIRTALAGASLTAAEVQRVQRLEAVAEATKVMWHTPIDVRSDCWEKLGAALAALEVKE